MKSSAVNLTGGAQEDYVLAKTDSGWRASSLQGKQWHPASQWSAQAV
jgi:hypothetical protein